MAKIGFLGLGEMGTPMAGRLLQAGHEVVVWNRSPERTAVLAKEGASVAASPAKAAAGRDLVITMLATPEALEQVLFGADGLAPALSPGVDAPDALQDTQLDHVPSSGVAVGHQTKGGQS